MDGKTPKVIENAGEARPENRYAFGCRHPGRRRRAPPRRPADGQAPGGDQPVQHRPLFAIKRLIGRQYTDPMVEKDKGMVPYEIVKGGNGDAWVRAHGKDYSPQEISAFILQKLKQDAEAHLGEKVDKAVITVPKLISTTASVRRRRTPVRSPASRCCASSTSRPPRRSPTDSRRTRARRSPVYDLRRWHVRHLDPGNRRRRLRGEGD